MALLPLRLAARGCWGLQEARQLCSLTHKFVPASGPVQDADVHSLIEFITDAKKLFIITGAGLSTESGIPDYRSTGVGLYATGEKKPIFWHEFLKDDDRRRRYWARNFAGWPRFSSRQPNLGHFFLSELERRGLLHWLVTQNVDRLHHKAGSSRLTELHGTTHDVICLECKALTTRHDLQLRMRHMNPEFVARLEDSHDERPDGDVSFKTESWKDFNIPDCQRCGGMLKPRVVFFGDQVPRTLVADVYDRLRESDAVLCIGTSLEVYSSFRFAREASELKLPLALLNIGKTRADDLATLHVQARCGETMESISEVLFGHDVYWLRNRSWEL